MNSSSENHALFEGNNTRPFFYVHAMGQHPCPSPWYQNLTYSPFPIPGAGFRNGGLYFPYSVVLNEYPGFLVPQSPLPTTLNRRPIFPVFCNPAQFRHYSGYGKKMKTKETQTEPQQAENMSKKQDIHSEVNGHDTGRVTSIPATNVDIETDNIPAKTVGALSSVAQKRELLDKSPSNNAVNRKTLHRSFTSEKEKMRIEQGEGSPVIQFRKTLKEIMRLLDLAYGEAVPENMVQQNEFSQSSCEIRGMLCNPHEDEDGITYEDEQRAVPLEQHLDIVRHNEMSKSGLTMEVNLDKEKKGFSAVPQILPSPDEVKGEDEIQNTLISKLCQSTGDGNKLQQESPLGVSMETVNDLSLQSQTQTPLSIGEGKPHNSSGSHGSLEKQDEDEVVESNNSPQGCVPSPTWVAEFNRVDESIMCDVSWWLDAEVAKSPESSPESCRKGTEKKFVGSRELNEDEVVENNNYSQGCLPSHTWLVPFNRVDEGIQCDMSWWQDRELEKSPESSPKISRNGTGKKSVGNRKLDEGEARESNSYPEKYVPSPTLLAQSKRVDVGIMCNMGLCHSEEVRTTPKEISSADEESLQDCNSKGSDKSGTSRECIQCDRSWWQDAELQKSTEQMPPIDEESSPDCKIKGSWKKSIRNRKLNTDEEEMIIDDETEEVYNENFTKYAKTKKTAKGRKLNVLNSFSNGKTVYLLKKNAALNFVLPEDSEDTELEQEVEDEMYEVACLFGEVSPQGPLTSSIGRLYRKSGRIIRIPPESSLPPQLIVWPRYRYKLKCGEYESIPMVYKVKRQDGCEITYGRLHKKHTMAKQERLESKRASHSSLECNCERAKTKVPYKLTSKNKDSRQMQ
uniref:Uncharacterized protein n=1 Tax=Equus caballus TaxID=9796 RepID=A0A5F5PJG3_HORSE|nr:uncharacterized protein LOC111767449 isoform X2 [Equus caballus]